MAIYPELDPPQKWYDRLVFGLCKRTGYGADPETGEIDESVYDGFDLATARWNLTTNQAEFDAAKAHFDAVLSQPQYKDVNPLVVIAQNMINQARQAAIVAADIND